MTIQHIEEPYDEGKFSVEDWKAELQALREEEGIEAYARALGGYCVAANNMYMRSMYVEEDEGRGKVAAMEWGNVLNPMVSELMEETPELAPHFVRGFMGSINGLLYS